MSYTYKIDNDPDELAKSKRIGGVAPKADNVLSVVQEKFTDNYSLFMDHVRRDENGGFKPMGEKIHEYTVRESDGIVYEVYKATFATPRFKAYNAALQPLLLFFIEGASAIDDEDDAWECFLVFEKRPVVGNAAFAYAIVGFSTAYAFWSFPDRKRMRISQFIIMPPYQKKGHGKQLYNTIKREFVSRSEVSDFGVEDPNEEFSNLRDICDVEFLVQEVERIRDSSRVVSLESLSRPATVGANGNQADIRSAINAVVSNVKNGVYKLSKAHAERCIEMVNLKYLDRADKAAAQEFRLMVKRRLYKRNEEALNGMPAEEMKEKLQATFLNVEEGYREVLSHI
ncbi:acyl-CoA N-acyltransferase [Rhizoclosmatium globosum]|uniref:Histone acetyltransferase type B catalytic subunit n=1 Tax=Rhizoclosmatium globosum TaxID=329046 RepID=A0A1Y2D169_9FUNG|nr:acyl-CoA N-acyltransferase [Rhizoclosmatium globosum]|eukprot:ORY53029.1 acyl-CoA N-acyltransferase [Rhizoclosmatium globosum]